MNYYMRSAKAKKALRDADYVLIGGGSGLSTAAGIEYSGKRFFDNFKPFIQKYGFTDMFSSGFYPFKTQEEKWAYWAKHIYLNRYETTATKLYKDIFTLIKEKNFFVISTNVESQFEKSGFPSDRVFEIQGNYGYLQCARACHNKLYDNKAIVKKMVEHTVDCKIPTPLVPICPVCGGEMEVNVRVNQHFVQDQRWYNLSQSYQEFIEKSQGHKVVYLELGVGFNTPGIIRYPFEQLTYQNSNGVLMRLNKDEEDGIKQNQHKTISFSEDMQEVISDLLAR
ncbi:SIR2 family NAD-dependent protein deacylase [Priestia megaterium]|uniref:SIR2 family NAD-dependent protein deacylase n=1 Tax=Priestia megaterium TaxID=1404 RepID=UPI00204178B1|nr:Sir2 silent information regulator family NAD-dependent deacetylase [Priestia megaterium]MCM3186850.1 Sir2 silent information regulator family NAD-dependent deacetylase [Priestia megaterium]